MFGNSNDKLARQVEVLESQVRALGAECEKLRGILGPFADLLEKQAAFNEQFGADNQAAMIAITALGRYLISTNAAAPRLGRSVRGTVKSVLAQHDMLNHAATLGVLDEWANSIRDH